MARKMRTKNGLSLGKIGEYCLVSTATVRRWIKSGELSAIRLPSGHYRVSIADFRDFLKQHNMPIKKELYEMSEIEAKLLETVQYNPNGVTLVQLTERLDVTPAFVGEGVRSLLDAGRIRKEGNRYYLANSGTS